MGKQPVRLKEVVYSLSPFQQKTMSGLGNDLPGKIHHKISENWIGASLLLGPLIGTYRICEQRQDQDFWASPFCGGQDSSDTL